MFVALDKSSNDLVAIKRVKITRNPEMVKRETKLLAECVSKYIVRYYNSMLIDRNYWVEERRLCNVQIVMEYCHCGSVASYLKNGNRLDESEIRDIVSSCLLGLSYLHSRRMVHRVASYGRIDM